MLGRLKNLYYKIKYSFLDKKIHLSKTAYIHHGATFIITENEKAKIEVEEGVYIGRFANIHTGSLIKIGKHTVLSDYVYLSTLAHGIEPIKGPIMSQETFDKGEIVLGENVFLGFGVKVMPNVKLDDWCIVGAGSVVTKSFPAFSMIAGNPAKLIKKYDFTNNEWVGLNEINS